MRPILAAILCTFLLAAGLAFPAAAAEPFQFAGIPWGSNSATVIAKMKAAGFVFKPSKKGDPTFGTDDLHFVGVLTHIKAGAFAYFDKGKLGKIMITMLPADADALRTYQDMRTTLVTKYDEPKADDTVAVIGLPYVNGDGHEEQAIRAGKGHFLTTWSRDMGGAKTSDLTVRIPTNLAVLIEYEGPEFAAASKQRQARGTENL